MAKKKAKNPRKKVFRTLKEIAAHFQRPYNTVRDWPREPTWPMRAGGPYPLDEIEKFLEARTRGRSGRGDGGADTGGGPANQELATALTEKRKAEARIKSAEAERKERENRLARANVVERRDVELFFSEFFSALRDAAEQIPEQVEPHVPREHRGVIVDEVRARVDLMLRTLRAYGDRTDEIGEAS